ncbi:MAG: hypothetical protein ACHQ50_10320 [Fimbriimonadales bacterium]
MGRGDTMWTADVAPRMVSNLQNVNDAIKAAMELSYEAIYHEALDMEEAALASVPKPLLRLCPGDRCSGSLSGPYLS